MKKKIWVTGVNGQLVQAFYINGDGKKFRKKN